MRNKKYLFHIGKIEYETGKTVDFNDEVDCPFLLQKFKYRHLSIHGSCLFDWRNLRMNDKNFIEELRKSVRNTVYHKRELPLLVVSAVNITIALKKENSH